MPKTSARAHVASSVKEDQGLIEAGFEYIAERSGVRIYRKPK